MIDRVSQEFKAYDKEMHDLIAKCPVCSRCKCTITEDEAYMIGHKLICIECMNDLYRVNILADGSVD